MPSTQDHTRNPAAIEDELARILASQDFAASGRLSGFLQFVVRKTLEGRQEDIKEYAVGTEVFDRPASFDPRVDTIVRVQASKLRQRLNAYYSGAGANDPIVISLPRGSYVPVFGSSDGVPGNTEAPVTDGGGASRRTGRRLWRWMAAGLAFAGVIALATAVAFGPGRTVSRPMQLRFTLDPPEDAGFFGPPAISHDGRHVVCVVRTKSGGTALWHRSLAAAAGKILQGTNGEWPSWSDDGRFVLYNDEYDVRLRKFDITTSGPPEIVPVPAPLAAVAWTGANVLLVPLGSGIVRMPSTGGAGIPVTRLDPAHGETMHLWPQMFPDGRHFLYFAVCRNPAENAIRVGSLDETVDKRLLTNESRGQFVASGVSNQETAWYVFFVQRGTLIARSFDAAKLEFTGAAKPVAEGVGQYQFGAAHFAASHNGILIYRRSGGAGSQFILFDRKGRELGPVGPGGLCADPAVSRDGRFLAFALSDGSNRDLWTVNLETRHTQRLSFNPEPDENPMWSPDGRRIAYESHQSALFVKPSTGGAPERLLVPWIPGRGSLDDWSPDGTAVLFSDWQDNVDIWLLPLSDRQKPFPWLQTKANEYYAKFSPNGKWVAYTSDESDREEIYVQAFDGTSPASGGKWMVSVEGGAQPSWRADGKELYYLSLTNRLMAVEVNINGVFQANVPVPISGLPTVLREGPRNDYAVTPDGHRFLIKKPWIQHPAPPLHVVANWAASLQ